MDFLILLEKKETVHLNLQVPPPPHVVWAYVIISIPGVLLLSHYRSLAQPLLVLGVVSFISRWVFESGVCAYLA